MYRGCGSQPGALCFLMHFQWLREHCFNKASSQRALPRGFGWRGSEAANELEPIEGCWDHRGGGHAEAVLCTSPGWHTGSGLEPTAPRRAEDRRIHRPPLSPSAGSPAHRTSAFPAEEPSLGPPPARTAPGPEPFPGVLKG